MSIISRLAKLESKQASALILGLSRVVTVGHDGNIGGCFVTAAGQAHTDLSSFYAGIQWRQRAACEDADNCEDAGRCFATNTR